MAQSFSLERLPNTTVMLVAGPTASGKSDWAMDQAETESALGDAGTAGCIINADSMQLYHGLDVLTAMPTAADQSRMNHHLYGFLSPYGEKYCVSRWIKRALDEIKQAHSRGQRVWIVGGTGFYLNTLEHGLSPIPDGDRAEKERLRRQYSPATVSELKTLLGPVDPVCAEHLVDHQRLLNAWIVYQSTGKPLTWWHGQPRVAPDLDFCRVLIWPSKEHIMHRAEKRLSAMIAAGLYDEVRAFCQHPEWEKSPLYHAIGLVSIHHMVHNQGSEQICHQQYLTDIARYVKRQRTWFRHQFSPDFVFDQEKPI